VNGGGGEPTTVRFHASEHAWMLTCSPLVGSVSSSDVGAAENLSVISLFAIVPPVEFRSAGCDRLRPSRHAGGERRKDSANKRSQRA